VVLKVLDFPSFGDFALATLPDKQHPPWTRMKRRGGVGMPKNGNLIPFDAARRTHMWLGWAYLAKTARKPQRGGVNFDPMIFVLVLCKMLQLLPKCSRTNFAQNKKFCPQKRISGA
jgi:hypothetical protein